MEKFAVDLPVEVWLGQGFDQGGDVEECYAEFLTVSLDAMGFNGVELGPVTFNRRVDKTYKDLQVDPTTATSKVASVQKFRALNDKQTGYLRRVSAVVEPSFGVLSIAPEYSACYKSSRE
jgi:hypothetical protein